VADTLRQAFGWFAGGFFVSNDELYFSSPSLLSAATTFRRSSLTADRIPLLLAVLQWRKVFGRPCPGRWRCHAELRSSRFSSLGRPRRARTASGTGGKAGKGKHKDLKTVTLLYEGNEVTITITGLNKPKLIGSAENFPAQPRLGESLKSRSMARGKPVFFSPHSTNTNR
jgi:hypothetical protein